MAAGDVLAGKVALITGASRGIGEATAKAMAAAGAEVVIAARGSEDLKRVAGVISGAGGKVRTVQADLSRTDVARALAEQAEPVDVLVNNAGAFMGFRSILEPAEEEWEYTFALNFWGALTLMREIGRGMVRRGGGSIINISTAGTLQPIPLVGAYMAAKMALEGVTKVMAMEVAHAGVRCNLASPGLIATEMAQQAGGEFYGHYREITPAGRWCTTEDFVPALVWLASDASAYVTGQHLVVDGGMTIGHYSVAAVQDRMGLSPRARA